MVDIFLLEVGGNAIEVDVAMGNIRCRTEVEIVVKTTSNFPPVLFDVVEKGGRVSGVDEEVFPLNF